MDRLRPRARNDFSGFTTAEVEKMEKLLQECGERVLDKDICRKLVKSFNYSSGRAGKPLLKLIEIQDWFKNMLEKNPPKKVSSSQDNSGNGNMEAPCDQEKEIAQISEEKKVPDLSELEFEARSSKDGAWYDVDIFLAHRILTSGEAEVRVRFIGFGAEEDEWVNVKNSVRVRSLPLEHYECHKVNVGQPLLCLQERRDQAVYYDAHVLDIQRKVHDIRGCRCIFLIRYDHDNYEENVRLRRLCWRLT